jgi:hypothetical protein
MFARWLAGDKKAISPHLRWEVFGIVAAHGGKGELEALLSIWRTSSNEDEKYLALECLGRGSSASLVTWVLSLAFTKDVKNADVRVFPILQNNIADSCLVIRPCLPDELFTSWSGSSMGVDEGPMVQN